MPSDRPRSLRGLISESESDLGRVVRHAEAMDRLRQRVSSSLPESAASHLVGTNVDGDTLVLMVDASAWADRIRYSREPCLEAASEVIGRPIRDLRVKVRPSDT